MRGETLVQNEKRKAVVVANQNTIYVRNEDPKDLDFGQLIGVSYLEGSWYLTFEPKFGCFILKEHRNPTIDDVLRIEQLKFNPRQTILPEDNPIPVIEELDDWVWELAQYEQLVRNMIWTGLNGLVAYAASIGIKTGITGATKPNLISQLVDKKEKFLRPPSKSKNPKRADKRLGKEDSEERRLGRSKYNKKTDTSQNVIEMPAVLNLEKWEANKLKYRSNGSVRPDDVIEQMVKAQRTIQINLNVARKAEKKLKPIRKAHEDAVRRKKLGYDELPIASGI